MLRGFGKGEGTVEPHTRKLTVPVTGGAKLLAEVIRELDARGIEIDDIGLRRPTLDDVFLSLTGHAAEAEEENGEGTEGGGDGGERRTKGGKGRKAGKPVDEVEAAGAGTTPRKEGVK